MGNWGYGLLDGDDELDAIASILDKCRKIFEGRISTCKRMYPDKRGLYAKEILALAAFMQKNLMHRSRKIQKTINTVLAQEIKNVDKQGWVKPLSRKKSLEIFKAAWLEQKFCILEEINKARRNQKNKRIK